MALNKPALKTGIRLLVNDLWDNTDDLTPEECREVFATRLSDLIDAFVKTGLVSVTVATTGTAAAHTGSGTGSIT